MAAAIIFTAVFSSIPMANADNLLSDIEGHWARGTIENMVDKGAVSGYPDGTFKPNNNITRAEFTSLFVKALNLESGSGKVFDDTANHWAKDVIKVANYHGLVNGYSDTLFGPDDPITREQMAVMVVNAIKMGSSYGSKTFADSAQISTWAKESVDKAAGAGLITGYPDGTFKPQANSTRSEAAVLLERIMQFIDEESDLGIPDIPEEPKKEPSTPGSPSDGGSGGPVSPPQKVDKEALQAKIDEAAGLEEKDYTAKSWAIFAGALAGAQAVSDDKDATQKAVDDALEALIGAIGGLESKAKPGVAVTLEIDPTKAGIGDEIALTGDADPNTFVSIKVVDGKEEIVYFDGTKSGSDGKYNTTFIVPNNIDGNLTIVTGYGSNVATKILQIIESQ